MAQRLSREEADALAERMLRYRARTKKTQLQVATECGLSKATWNYVETKSMLPTKKTAMQIEIGIDGEK